MITIVTNTRKIWTIIREKKNPLGKFKKIIFLLLKEPKVPKSFTGGLGKDWVVLIILNNVTRFCVQTHNTFIFANH